MYSSVSTGRSGLFSVLQLSGKGMVGTCDIYILNTPSVLFVYSKRTKYFIHVLQHQPPMLFQQCVMDERWWTPQHPPCEDRPSSSAKRCKQSYLITSPGSGVSDIKEVTQTIVLT